MGCYSGNMAKITEDIQALKPNIFAGVPRIFTKIYDNMKAGIASLPKDKKSKVEGALNTKLKNLNEEGAYKHFLYDKLIFSKFKKALGGNIELCVSGSAPLPHECANFLKVVLGCPVIEGYGATETCSGCTMGIPENYLSGTIGGPYITT